MNPVKKVAALVSFSVVLIGMIWLFFYQASHAHEAGHGTEVHDFETCVEAGGNILESYPRQCAYENHTYTEVLEASESSIGGQRDEHGCLGPAGYAYDENVSACIRSWELNDNQKQAAAIAVNHIGPTYATTVLEVLVARCPGCFVVQLSQGVDHPTQTNVTLEGFEVVGTT